MIVGLIIAIVLLFSVHKISIKWSVLHIVPAWRCVCFKVMIGANASLHVTLCGFSTIPNSSLDVKLVYWFPRKVCFTFYYGY